MLTNFLTTAAKLSNRDLLRQIEALAGQERHATVELIVHLAELDKRKLYRGEGYGSLFSYCTQALRFSEHAAYNRIEAARVSRAFPIVLDLLADGSLNLSTLRLLAPHVTPDNHERLLGEAKGLSKRDVEMLLARLAPQPDVPSSIRKLPAAAQPSVGFEAPAGAAGFEDAAPARDTPCGAALTSEGSARDSHDPPMPITLAPRVPTPPSPRPAVVPLSPERFRVQFTIGRETHDKLHRVQDLLRREIPDGDPGAIFERALALLLEDVARKKVAATMKPRPHRGSDPRSRYIPAEVKRTVWLRDGGQCAFVAKGGRRCRDRAFLEFHHVEPYGIGGETIAANLSLRCREHNAYEADLVFGRFEPVVREAPAVYVTRIGVVQRSITNPVAFNSPRGESGRDLSALLAYALRIASSASRPRSTRSISRRVARA